MFKESHMKSAKVLAALSNRSRIVIIEILMTGEKQVNEINKQIPALSQPALSQHLAVMVRAGILQPRRKSREVFYSIKDADLVSNIIKLAEMVA